MSERPKSRRGEWLRSLTPEQRREISRLGGRALAEDREHMSRIGRKGGKTTALDRGHMAEIGRAVAATRKRRMYGEE